MKKLLSLLAVAGLAQTLQATTFIVTNNYNYPHDQYAAVLFIYHENQKGADCNKTGAMLLPGKTTTKTSATYKKWLGGKAECGVKSIEIALQDKKTGKQTSLFTATADQLEAHAMRALTKQGKAFGLKSKGDRYTGTFVIDMDSFDVELK